MGSINIKNSDTQDTPSAGYSKLYPKTDKKFYYKDDAGLETALSCDEFINLTDTPSDYTSQAGKTLVVNSGEDALEFAAAGVSTLEEARAADNELSGDIDFNNNDITDVKAITFQDGGSITWNSEDYTLNIPTGLGPILQVGQEVYKVVYNDTGSQINNGHAVRIAGPYGSTGYQKVVLAIASTFEGFGNGVLIATMDIPDSTYGIVTSNGKVRDMNTSALTLGKPVYLSATTLGSLTNTSPPFPAYEIFVGGVLKSDATTGILNVETRRTKEDTFENFWNGTIRETFDFRITSDGSTITGTLTASSGSDELTLMCSTGFTLLDVSTPPTIALTAGTATNPQTNYVYILCSTSALTVSTSGFPADVECIPIAKVVLQTAPYTQTYGALKNHNINNALVDNVINQGHVVHIGDRIRILDAAWDSGIEGSLTISGTPDDVFFSNTAGKVYQMHKQTFVDHDMATGDSVFIVNDPTTAYKPVSNLNTITEDANGDSIDGDFFNIVVWGVANKTGETSQIMVNLPNGSYGKEGDALKNKDSKDVYTIPSAFKGVGFLIARFTIEKDGTNWTYDSSTGYLDLRGFVPNSTAGSGVGGSGVTDFTGLTDTPSSYVGEAGKVVAVNSGETELEFIDASGGVSAPYVLTATTNDGSTKPWSIEDSDNVEQYYVNSDGQVHSNFYLSSTPTFGNLSKNSGVAINNSTGSVYLMVNTLRLLTLDNNGLSVPRNGIFGSNGTVSIPAVSFGSAGDVGFYKNTTNDSLCVSVNDTLVAEFDDTTCNSHYVPTNIVSLTTTERDALTPAAGWMIFNTTTSKHQGYNGSTWNDFY